MYFCLPIKTSKLRTSELSLQFPNFESLEECNILCYSDAAFADLYNDRLQDACAKITYKDGTIYALVLKKLKISVL